MTRALAVLLLLVPACATTGPTQRRTGNVITFEEIRTLQVPSAWEIVEMLRPQFLRTRGSVSFNDPTPVPAVVYVDGLQYGATPQALKTIERTVVREIEYLDSRDATTRFGTGHRGGAILVKTR